MKRIVSLCLSAMLFSAAQAQITETATEAVKNMGVGWNLGNTLDANSSSTSDINSPNYWGKQGVDSETMWGQPVTKPELFQMMKEAGFGAIRVPTTWYNHMTQDGTVDKAWMARVHTVVDNVLDAGLYCILNVHHDTGAGSSWIKADETWYNNVHERYEKLWRQIAEEFKDYGDKLLFESYNEMLDTYNSWCFATFARTAGYNAAEATSAYNGINNYAQSFVDVVRSTGSNNSTRNLVVNTYAASNGYGNWNVHLKDVLTYMNLPTDAATGHLIFEVHDYPPIVNTDSKGNVTNRSLTDIKGQVDGTIKVLKDNLIKKGAPVIIGEWGTNNVDAGAGKTDYDVRRELMFQFADYYVKKMKENGIATFYWMGMSDGVCRSMPAFSQPDLAETVVKAYHGSDFDGKYPTVEDADEYVCFEGDKLIDWGNGITVPADVFRSVGEGAQLELTFKQSGSNEDIQMMTADWKDKVTFSVDGKSYAGDFNPMSHYGTPDGTEHVTCFTFNAATYANLALKGVVVHGIGVRLQKAVLKGAKTDGVKDVTFSESVPMDVYDLAGRKSVGTLKSGINILRMSDGTVRKVVRR